MVDFNIHYRDEVVSKRSEACFGSLFGEKDRWGQEGNDCEFIEYLPTKVLQTLLDERIDWLKNHRLFGIAVRNVTKIPRNSLSILVRCDVPADLMMATLSVARVLFDENRRPETNAILDYYKATGDMDLAFAMGEMCYDYGPKGLMFQRRDESIVPDFSISDYLKWYKDPTCNGTGIEEHFSKRKTYKSVKTALTGKPLGDYHYHSKGVNKVQFMDFINYEGKL